MATMSLKLSLLSIVLLAMVAGCSPRASAGDLLLAPSDFPTLNLEAGQPQVSLSNRGGQSAQVTLAGSGARIFHSVVVFGSVNEARQALDNVGTGTFGETRPGSDPGLGDSSLVIEESQGTERRISVLFRKGTVFERISIAGNVSRDDAVRFARIAEQKA